MASILSWLNPISDAKRLKDAVVGGWQTVDRNVVNPVAHAAGNVVNALSAHNTIDPVARAISQAPQMLNRDAIQPLNRNVIRPVFNNVVRPVLNTPQTFNNDVIRPINRDVIKPVFNLPQTLNNDVISPIRRNFTTPITDYITKTAPNDLSHAGDTISNLPFNRFLSQSSLGRGVQDVAAAIVKPFAETGNALAHVPQAIVREVQNKPINDIQQNVFGTNDSGAIARNVLGNLAQEALTFAPVGKLYKPAENIVSTVGSKVIPKALQEATPQMVKTGLTMIGGGALAGAVPGAAFNTAGYISDAKNPTVGGVLGSAGTGALFGGALGAAPIALTEGIRGSAAGVRAVNRAADNNVDKLLRNGNDAYERVANKVDKLKANVAQSRAMKVPESKLKNRLNTIAAHEKSLQAARNRFRQTGTVGKNIAGDSKFKPGTQKVNPSSLTQKVVTEEQYLSSKGAGFLKGSEPALDRQPNISRKIHIRNVQTNMSAIDANNATRASLRKEYQQKVANGELRAPTREEKLIVTANGHPDLQSTQAARRLLAKQGIDWNKLSVVPKSTANVKLSQKTQDLQKTLARTDLTPKQRGVVQASLDKEMAKASGVAADTRGIPQSARAVPAKNKQAPELLVNNSTTSRSERVAGDNVLGLAQTKKTGQALGQQQRQHISKQASGVLERKNQGTNQTTSSSLAETIDSKPVDFNPIRPLAQSKSGTGVSQLATKTKQSAFENHLIKKAENEADDIPAYNKANLADQAKTATNMVKADPKNAIDIALGNKPAPANVLPQMVYNAVERHATEMGGQDGGELLRQLAKSKHVSNLTTMAQNVRAAGERDPHSPITQMNQIDVARRKSFDKTGNNLKAEETKDIEAVNKATDISKKADWEEFVRQLQNGEFGPTLKRHEAFLNAVKTGTIDPDKLMAMNSDTRKAYLSKFVSKNDALKVNSLFESKMLLKNQKRGMITWVKHSSEITPEAKRDMVHRIERLQDVLSPTDKKQFLASLTETRLGLGVSADEAANIANLSKVVSEAESKQRVDGSWPSEDARLTYGNAVIDLTDYTHGLMDKAQKLKFANFVPGKGQPIKSSLELARKTAGNMKAISASMDDSAIFRQGWRTMWTNPNIWAKNAAKTISYIGKEFAGKDAMRAVNADIVSRPTYDLMVKGKLAVGNHEEFFPESLAGKIPVLKRLYKASESAYTGFVQRTRADVFDKYLQIAEKNGVDIHDRKELKAIGSVVNSLTGRASLGRLEPIGDTVNNFFFSPRFLKSQIDTITQPFRGGGANTGFAQRMAAKNLLKIVGGTATVLMTAKMINPSSVTFDPTSSDFGKIKVGDTRFDVTGGMASLNTLVARLVSGHSDNTVTGVRTDLTKGQFGDETRLDAFESYILNKLSPAAGIARDKLKGQDFSGNPFNLSKSLLNSVTPIGIQNISELRADKNSANPLLATILDGLGIGQNTYGVGSGFNLGAKSAQEFKQRVGDKQFGKVNQQLQNKYSQQAQTLVNTPKYQQMNNDDRQKALTSLKKQVEQQVYSDNNFTPTTSGSGIHNDINKSISSASQAILNQYQGKTSEYRTNQFNTVKDAEYKYDQAKYENDVTNGKLTTTEKIRAQDNLAKEKVGSVYPKNVRDLYSLSKADLWSYLNTSEKGVDKQKITKQLIAYDQALQNAGVISRLKFKTGIAPSSGSRSTTNKARAAQLKFALARKAPKIIGATKLTTKSTAPSFTSGLVTVFRPRTLDRTPTVSIKKSKLGVV